MGCQKSLTLNQSSLGDLSLDQAIYEPVSGFVFGVRGQWVYKFNATSGAFVAGARFVSDATSPSCITSIAGTLYCGVAFTPITDGAGNFSNLVNSRDIFRVDSNLNVIGRENLYPISELNIFVSGYRHLFTDGTYLAGWTKFNNAPLHSTTGLFNYDPSNIAGTFARSTTDFGDDWCYDPVNNVYWMADSEGPDIWAFSARTLSSHCFDLGGLGFPHGITYNQAQNKVYAVQGDDTVVMARGSDAFPGFNNFPVTTFHTGRLSSNPFRIKSCNNLPSNPYNGKVLIPTWADDAVVIWNPLTDTVDSVKTGFTAPWDIVHCPTVSFAVQNHTTGLKVI